MDRTYTDADFAEEETTYTDADFADDNTPAAQTFTDADFLPDAPQASDQISLLDAIDQNTGGMLATVKGIPSNLSAAGKMALGDVASVAQRFQGAIQSNPTFPQVAVANRQADELNRATAQMEQEAAQQDVAAGRSEFFGKTTRGVTRSLATAAPMGMALGPAGAIGGATLIQGSQSSTEALDAGIPEGERARFVAEQMMWEGLPATLMQRVGLGGLESQLGTLANPAKRGISAALRGFGISSIQELPEEYVTALGQAVSRVASGVGKPEEIGADGLYSLMRDVTVQTLGTTGLVSAAGYRPARNTPPDAQPSPASDGPPTTPQDLTLQPEPQYDQTYEQEFGDVWADLAQETPQGQPAPTPSPDAEVAPQATVAPTATPSETPEQFAERIDAAGQMEEADFAYYRENQAAVDEALRQMYDQYAEVDAVDEEAQQPAEMPVVQSELERTKAELDSLERRKAEIDAKNTDDVYLDRFRGIMRPEVALEKAKREVLDDEDPEYTKQERDYTIADLEYMAFVDRAIQKATEDIKRSRFTDPVSDLYDMMGIMQPGGDMLLRLGVGRMRQHEGRATFNIESEATLRRLAQQIYKAQAESEGLDPDGLLGAYSGLTDSGKKIRADEAMEKAKYVIESIKNSLDLYASPPSTTQRAIAAPQPAESEVIPSEEEGQEAPLLSAETGAGVDAPAPAPSPAVKAIDGPIQAIHYSRTPMRLSSDADISKIEGVYSAYEDSTFGAGFYAMEPSDESMWKGMGRFTLGPHRNEVQINPRNPLVISPETVKQRGFDAINEALQSGNHDAIISRGWGDADMRMAVHRRTRQLWKPKFPEGKTEGRFTNVDEFNAAREQAIREVTGINPSDYDKLTKADWDQNQIFVPTKKAPEVVSGATQREPTPQQQGIVTVNRSGEQFVPQPDGSVLRRNGLDTVRVSGDSVTEAWIGPSRSKTQSKKAISEARKKYPKAKINQSYMPIDMRTEAEAAQDEIDDAKKAEKDAAAIAEYDRLLAEHEANEEDRRRILEEEQTAEMDAYSTQREVMRNSIESIAKNSGWSVGNWVGYSSKGRSEYVTLVSPDEQQILKVRISDHPQASTTRGNARGGYAGNGSYFDSVDVSIEARPGDPVDTSILEAILTPAATQQPAPIHFKHSGKGDTAVYEASIEGRAVTISRGKDGWEVRLDGRVKDVRPTIKAARDYAKGELRQDLVDERNAREDTAFESAPIESPRAADRNYAAMDDATLGSVISRAQSQGDTRTMIDALNERKRRRGPAPADTGIYRDLTAAAREGKRFVEALYPRIQPVLARIHAEAKSAVDFVRRAVAKIGEHIKPYARRFLADVRAVNKEFRQNPTRGSVPDPRELMKEFRRAQAAARLERFRQQNADYRIGRREGSAISRAEKQSAKAETRAEERERTKGIVEKERMLSEKIVQAATGRAARQGYAVGKEGAQQAAKADMAEQRAVDAERAQQRQAKAVARATSLTAKQQYGVGLEAGRQAAKADIAEAKVKAETKGRIAGVKQGHKEGVLRQQQDTRAMLDIARQVLPANEWRAIAKAAMSISRMRNSTEAGKRRALDRVLNKHLAEIRRGQALSKTQKTIKAIKQKFNKLRPEVQDAITDIFKGFREKNITEATYDKALSVLARGTSGKDAVTPKQLARAAKIIESFEGDDKPELLRNLSQQELESISDMLESLMEKNDAMNAGIVAEMERQKLANNTLAVEEVKARGPVTLKNLTFENKAFRSIGDTILNIPNIVRGIATKSGHVYKTLVSDLVEADTKTQAMLLKHSRIIQRAVAEAGITPDQIRSMSAIDNSKVEEVEVAGVKMTKGERISLLLHLSDPDTRAILMNPKSLGFKFSRAESGANRRLKITPEVAEEIENSATPEELKLARIFFDWSNGEVMNDVNELSTRVFGYKMFRNDQHWNRRRNITDKEPAIGLQADGTQAQQEAIDYFKDRTGGTSYIIVDDAFQHVASHMNAIAALVGKFEASVNARRLLGTSAFQDAVAENRRTGGKILQELNKRINEWGAISNPRPEAGMRFVRWAGRNYTSSKLATNFSVIISQPFSVLSAAKVIPSKYIAKTFAATPMDINALAEIEATPEAADLYYIVHGGGQHIVTPGSMAGATMGDIFKTAKKPFTDKMMTFVERGNDMAVFNIWRAAKAWGQDQGLSGDELMRFTAKTARDAWLQTQPSHSSVYHSGIKLRSRSSPTAYALSMFQGQTAIQFQDAIDSVRDYQELPDSQKTAAERAKVMAKFARPIILQAAMFEALKYAGSEAWDWIFGKSDAKKARDKKIDPVLDKFIEVVKSPVSSIPGFGPILDTSIEVYKRMALGMPKIDTISNPILSSVEDVALAPAAAIKILNRLKDGKEPRLTDARALARGVDVLSGVPTGNFVEWVSALSSMLMR